VGSNIDINITIVKDAGEIIFMLLKKHQSMFNICKMFWFENMFDCNINNEITNELNNFLLLKFSKKGLLLEKITYEYIISIIFKK